MARPRLTKLLVANRGEIARRVIAAAHEMGIATVAVFSDVDADAPFVADADEAVPLPGSRAADTYLHVQRILDAARRTGADSLHPGYGFLAENADLAEACDAAGVVFVGPPAASMRSMADKIGAKAIAASVGVPVLPTFSLDAASSGSDGQVDLEAMRFPVLVKAAAGGGGTGIHLVDRPENLHETVSVARREAEGAFGDGTLFAEPYLAAPHHVEVQVLADSHGHIVHLFERECSIQRRHQKVIEEAPSPSVDESLRDRMCSAAVALARAVRYVGVGTVEFLVDGGTFYFLEMNTRLQVEHRVTEAVTGIDLVRSQLLVAEGRPLDWQQASVTLSGAAIEGRLYAEDPSAGYLPVTGSVDHYAHGRLPGVLFDDGIASGSVVSPHYDGLLAKIVAHGPTRLDAAARLDRAVRGIQLDGIRTNRELLAAVLGDEEFLAGHVDTTYLERRRDLARVGLPEHVADAHAVAAAHARMTWAHRGSPLAFAPLGWRNVGATVSTVTLQPMGGGPAMAVSLERSVDGRVATVGDRRYVVTLASDADTVDVTFDGVRRRCTVRRLGERWSVNSPAGQSDFEVLGSADSRAEGSSHGAVVSSVPGSVSRVLVAAGDAVAAGDVLVVVEAMKMEHRVAAPADGVVTSVAVAPGDVVDAHQVLAVVAETAPEESS